MARLNSSSACSSISILTGGSGKAGLPLMPARAFSPMARIAMALAFLKPSRIRWNMQVIPSVNNRYWYGNDQPCYNDHFLREQVDRVRPEHNLLASGNNHRQCEGDYSRHGNNHLWFKLYCFAAGLHRLGSEDNHVRAGNDRLEAGNKYVHDDQDCLSLGLDRYDGKQDRYNDGKDRYGDNKDRYDRGKDRYNRTPL